MSSGSSSLPQNSSSEEDAKFQMMDERKRKRMESNRESARRSRMKKQKHLDDLTAQVTNLRKMNNHIADHIKITTQQYMKVESENCVLRAQMSELSSRLESLEQISNVFSTVSDHNCDGMSGYGVGVDDQMMGFLPMVQQQMPLSNDCFFNHPIMTSSCNAMFHC